MIVLADQGNLFSKVASSSKRFSFLICMRTANRSKDVAEEVSRRERDRGCVLGKAFGTQVAENSGKRENLQKASWAARTTWEAGS